MLLVAIALGGGCGVPEHLDRAWVDGEVARRTGAMTPETSTRASLPPGADLADGLESGEAVAIAIWRNAAFAATLAEVEISRAQLVQAGTLPNPSFSLLAPLGPKQLEFTLKLPIEALFLRGRRVAAAREDAADVAQRVVQQALDLVRDVRIAHADAWLAAEMGDLAHEAFDAANAVAVLETRRREVGDASAAEENLAYVERARAATDADRADRDLYSAQSRLALLIGLPEAVPIVRADVPASSTVPELSALLPAAMISRPDLRALDHAIAAASTRADTSRLEFLSLAGIADANGSGKQGFEIGPGVEVGVPLFNWNQGGIARADAELVRTRARRAAIRDRIAAEVREAHAQLTVASARVIRTTADAPRVAAVRDHAARAYRNGDGSYLALQRATLVTLAAQRQSLEAAGDHFRAIAQLERAMGGAFSIDGKETVR